MWNKYKNYEKNEIKVMESVRLYIMIVIYCCLEREKKFHVNNSSYSEISTLES